MLLAGMALLPGGAWAAADADRVMDWLRAQRTPMPPDVQEWLRQARAWMAGAETPHGRWIDGPVRQRVLEPPGARGIYLHFHGGGWVLGSALSGEAMLWEVACAAGVTVVSPEYRLAPEHPFPAAVDDAVWALRQALDRGGPVVVGGRSAGAHLAASALARVGGAVGAVLWYGCYDLSGTPSARLATDASHPDLEPSLLQRCIGLFAGGRDLRSAAVSPLYGELSEVPPALFLVGSRDMLRDDSAFMASRWPSSTLVEYPGGMHGFDGYDLEMARDARRREVEFLRGRIAAAGVQEGRSLF